MESRLDIDVPPVIAPGELALLRRRLLAKGRDLAEALGALLAGLRPKATDLLDAKPGETRIERVRRYLGLVDRKVKEIDAGSYGRCEGCGALFSFAQLNETPWIDRCKKCDAVWL